MRLKALRYSTSDYLLNLSAFSSIISITKVHQTLSLNKLIILKSSRRYAYFSRKQMFHNKRKEHLSLVETFTLSLLLQTLFS